MKKKLEKKINLFLSLLIIVVLLPLLATILLQRMQLSNLIAGMEEGKNASDSLQNSKVEDAVLRIVANEISVNSSREAILAQSVIARTNLYAAWETKTKEPEALDIGEMQNIWGEEFQTVYRKLEECVEQTKGEVLVWKGDYIYAAYHAISAGETRTMSELYSESDMPYLSRVSCLQDAMAEGYLSVIYLEPQEIKDAVIVSRDTAGYVLEVQTGGDTCTGEEFRSKYGLSSACFTMKETNGKIRIVTRGLGHGLGLSQHTAVHMAEEGKNYKEILEYFYPGTVLENAENVK